MDDGITKKRKGGKRAAAAAADDDEDAFGGERVAPRAAVWSKGVVRRRRGGQACMQAGGRLQAWWREGWSPRLSFDCRCLPCLVRAAEEGLGGEGAPANGTTQQEEEEDEMDPVAVQKKASLLCNSLCVRACLAAWLPPQGSKPWRGSHSQLLCCAVLCCAVLCCSSRR